MSVSTDAGTAGGRADRRQFLFGGALLAAAAAGTALRPHAGVPIDATALDATLPPMVGPYRSAVYSDLVAPPPDDVSARIYDRVASRFYVAPGLPTIMALIAYGGAENGALALHRPENCYTAAGYTVTPARAVTLTGPSPRTGAASILGASLDGRTDQIYFWTRIGDRFPASGRQERWAVMRANLHGILPDGVLVRLSMSSDDLRAALPALQRFNADLLREVGAAGRRLLLGPLG